jgi:hypothetical protein
MNDFGMRQVIRLNTNDDSPTKSTMLFNKEERESSESSDSGVLSSKRDSPEQNVELDGQPI